MNTQPPTFAKLIRENALIGQVFEHTATPAPQLADGEAMVTEAIGFEGSSVEDGVVRSVKLLGLKSKNGLEYPLPVLEACKSLYDGAPVYVDHSLGPRSYGDRLGIVSNPQVRSGDGAGLYGDVVYNEKHPVAEQFCYDARKKSARVGFSHNAIVRYKPGTNNTVVEAIRRVVSVDLVTDPATTKSIFESTDPLAELENFANPKAPEPANPIAVALFQHHALLPADGLKVTAPDGRVIVVALEQAAPKVPDQTGDTQLLEQVTKLQADLAAERLQRMTTEALAAKGLTLDKLSDPQKTALEAVQDPDGRKAMIGTWTVAAPGPHRLPDFSTVLEHSRGDGDGAGDDDINMTLAERRARGR